MSLSLPLAVRISTGKKSTVITSQIRDLDFRIAIPGGFASATFNLNRPLDVQPDDIGYYASVYVYDARTCKTIWEGRLEDPGRAAGSDGEIWSISATGPSAHAQDITTPLIYVDRSLERWHRSRYSTHQAQTETGEVPDVLSGSTDTDDNQALIVRAEQGVTVTTAWQGDWIYRQPIYAGLLIARIRADFVCEGASSNYQATIYGRTGNQVASSSFSTDWVTTPNTVAANYGNGLDPATNAVSLRGTRTNSSTTADDKACIYFYNVVVRCAIKKLDGTDNLSTTGYNVNNIDPSEVVTDLLGRCLPRFDGPNATIIGSGVDLEQLCYSDGATAAQVLEDIAVYDPGFYWAAWETQSFNFFGRTRHRFEYVPWPTQVRYEATILDGFDSPGSAVDLYNQVGVRWRDPTGRVRHTTRTQTVPELSAQGLKRKAYVDLSDEIGTLQNATYAGDNFLAEHRYPPNAGTLTVSRPIVDHVSGRTVMPWEILPGNLIRVKGISPRVDALNPTNRDGVTVFRIVSNEFNTASASASLELDSMTRTVARALANLANTRVRKR